MTTTDIRTTLTEVARATDVPDVDQLAFQSRVRAARRRRTTSRTLAAAAVGVVAVLGITGARTIGGGDAADLPPSGDPTAEEVAATAPVNWFALDGRLAAVDPTGRVHRLDQRVEAIIGYTPEVVYAVDAESRLVAYEHTYAEGGAWIESIAEVEVPVPGRVQRVDLSSDGRYLAWIDLRNGLHRYDLESGRTDLETQLDEEVGLVDVSAAGALLENREELMLLTGEAEQIPVPAPDGVVPASLSGDLLAVPESFTGTRLYDLSAGTARLTRTVDGPGVISPDARWVAVFTGPFDEPGSSVALWNADGELRPLQGIDRGIPVNVRWADEQSLLVFTTGPDGTMVYLCAVDLRCSELPVEGDVESFE